MSELRGKQLQLLKETVPRLSRVAVLSDPNNPPHPHERKWVDDAARVLQVRLRILEVRAPSDFPEAFSMATRERAGALMVLGGSMLFTHRVRLAELATRSRLPALLPGRDSVEAGGLIAYGVDVGVGFRRAADYVDRILRGARPTFPSNSRPSSSCSSISGPRRPWASRFRPRCWRGRTR